MALQAPPFQAMKSLKRDVSCAIFALVFLPLTTHAEASHNDGRRWRGHHVVLETTVRR